MKVIHDDIIFNLQKKGGITNYWKNLKLFLGEKLNLININGYSQNERNIPIRILRYINSKKSYNTKFIFHSSYYRSSKDKKAINIITVYDFIYEKFSKGIKKKIHLWQKKIAIKNSHHIICISHSTKKDLLRFYPKINLNKVSVIYLGAADTFKNIRKSKINNSLIFVGGRGGYKNFNVVIDALIELSNYSLIIIGGGNLSNYEIKKLNNIKYDHILDCSDEELNKLYNNSAALIYPSLYEGFGLPIIEALKAGCPVVCNNGSSTGEIGKEYVLSGIISKKFIVDSILKLENYKFRKNLVKKGIKYASLFKWEKTAQETLSVYNELWKKYH